MGIWIDGHKTGDVDDYTSAASIDPGHKHSALWATDGMPQAVFGDGAGTVGVGGVADGSNALKVAGDLLADGEFTVQDGVIWFTDGTLAHGMTDYLPTNAYAELFDNVGAGGLKVIGASDDANTIGVNILGLIGVVDPTDTIPCIVLTGAKKNGTSVQAMGAAETVLSIYNNATELLTLLGDGTFLMKDPDVAHGMTTVAPTSAYGKLVINDGTKGGLQIDALTDNDAIGLYIKALSGAANPTAEVIRILAAKKDGTGYQALAAGETLLTVYNSAAHVLSIKGNGRVGINKTAPGSLFAVAGLPSYSNNDAALSGGLTAGDFYRLPLDPGNEAAASCVCVVY